MRILTVIIVVVALMTSCQSRKNEGSNKNVLLGEDSPVTATGGHKIIAKEAITAGSYTYVRFEEDGKDVWAAVTARDVETGGIYYYDEIDLHVGGGLKLDGWQVHSQKMHEGAAYPEESGISMEKRKKF